MNRVAVTFKISFAPHITESFLFLDGIYVIVQHDQLPELL